MRSTNLLALFVSASLVLMTDLASAQDGPPPSPATPIKLDNTKGTSLTNVRSGKADGVEENRAWFMPQVIIDWFFNLFKSARLKHLEEQVAGHHDVGPIVQASEITKRLEPLMVVKDHPFATVNDKLDPKMLKAHKKNAVELFKSHEFTALYGRLGKLIGDGANEVMYQILVRQLKAQQTALWLHLAKGSGSTKVAKVATAVEKVQFRKWGVKGYAPQKCAVVHLETPEDEVGMLLRDSKNTLSEIMWNYYRHVGVETFGFDVIAPVKKHSHHHGHHHGPGPGPGHGHHHGPGPGHGHDHGHHHG